MGRDTSQQLCYDSQMKRAGVIPLLAVASLCVAAACQDNAAPVIVASIQLHDSLIVELDSPRVASVSLSDATGHPISGRQVLWAISDTTIARVDSAGTVRGLRIGIVRLVAAIDSLRDSATVLVVPR